MSFGDGGGLFRDRALHRGDMRESLDERVRVVDIPRWIALVIGVLLLCGFAAWSASSEIDTTVEAAGVTGSSPPPAAVDAPVAGEVVTDPPAPGASVGADDALVRIRSESGRSVPVRAFQDGTVSAVEVRAGSVVKLGDPIARVEPAGAGRSVYLFVPTREASDVEEGQDVTLARGATGAGTVRRVGTSPASPARLEQILGPSLAARYAEGPPVIEVEVEPEGDRGGSASSLGATVDGRVVVSRRSPLDFVF